MTDTKKEPVEPQASEMSLSNVGRLCRRFWASKWALSILIILTILEATNNLFGLVFSMAERSSVDVSQELVSIEELLFTMPLILGAILLFTRRLGLKFVMLAFLLSSYDNHFGFIDDHWHNFLDDNQLYPLALRRGDPDADVNIQYAVLSFYVVIYAGLALMMCRAKWRSFERIFVLLIMSVMLGTTVLFHQVFIHNALVSEFEQARAAKRAHYASLVHLPDQQFLSFCKQRGMNCQVGVLTEPIAIADTSLQPALAEAAKHLKNNPQMATQTYDQALRVSTLQGVLTGHQIVMHRYGALPDARYRLIVDHSEYTHIPNRHKVHFTGLMIVAHSWWIGGGLLLIAFHRRRFAKRFGARVQPAAGGVG
ncbi:MAG: hypothetical protein AAF213_03075 [Pseudomonadota bacterium]